jgi:hypothetical protein
MFGRSLFHPRELHMRIRAFVLVLFSLTSAYSVNAQEHFGEFKDALRGEFIDAQPRPKFRLSSMFRFADPNGLMWTVPPNKEVDGASIPQAFWSIIGGPFEGAYIRASVIHDHYCDVKTRTEHDTHRNFYYGMRAAGVEDWQAKFMYWAVSTFGPKWKLEKRVVQNLKCDSGGSTLECTQVPEVVVAVVSSPNVDLGDPQTLAAALSKASTVARTLKTTDGKILDVSAHGQVFASLDGIARSADTYRAVFSTKDFLINPAKLGVLSKWEASGIGQVPAWENNRVPKYSEAVILKASSLEQIEAGKHFKLDANSKGLIADQIDLKSLEMKSVVK